MDAQTKELVAELDMLDGRGLSRSQLRRALRVSESGLSRLKKLRDWQRALPADQRSVALGDMGTD
jgi:hypothetical protein